MGGISEEFWSARPALSYIRDFAKATRIGPTALLASTLARVSAATPPNVVMPPLTGSSPGSINFDVALVGGSGAGKGLAEGGSRDLIPDIRNATTTQPASGEGLAAIFEARIPVPEDEGGAKGETKVKCVTPRALLSISEISELGGVTARSGSTVVPTLCSAWSGEALGAHNKNEANRLTVPPHAYRLSMVVGVQPGAAATLFSHEGVGLPQRFLWSSAIDPDAPEHAPSIPAAAFPFTTNMLPPDPASTGLDSVYEAGTIRGSLSYKLTYMDFTDIAYMEADRQRLAVLHGADLQPLDSHLIQLKAKVAALLALMDGGRMSVSDEDWQLAGCIIENSCKVRDMCLEQMHQAKQRSRADFLADDNIAHEMADAKRMEIVRGIILSFLAKHDPAHEGVKGWRVRQGTGKYGRSCYDALESLYEDGKVEKIGPSSDKISSTIWCLST